MCFYTMEEIYSLINDFRVAPKRFAQEQGWQPACTRPLTVSYDPLVVLAELEDAAEFQAVTCLECGEFTHRTCDRYCSMFGGSCSYVDRINHFVGSNASYQQEVLTYGPKHPVKWLVQTQGHCDHILSPDINAMGVAFLSKLFILSMVYRKDA